MCVNNGSQVLKRRRMQTITNRNVETRPYSNRQGFQAHKSTRKRKGGRSVEEPYKHTPSRRAKLWAEGHVRSAPTSQSLGRSTACVCAQTCAPRPPLYQRAHGCGVRCAAPKAGGARAARTDKWRALRR